MGYNKKSIENRVFTVFSAFSFRIENIFKVKVKSSRSTPNTAPLTCGACYSTQPEGLLTMA